MGMISVVWLNHQLAYGLYIYIYLETGATWFYQMSCDEATLTVE